MNQEPELTNKPDFANKADFTNKAVDLAGIPQLGDADFRPLERKLLTLRMVLLLIPLGLLFLAAVAVAILIDDPRWLGLVALLAVVLIASVLVVATRLSFSYWGYAVREHDLTVRNGVLIRTATTVPFNRVQHASVHSGPLERSMGLSTIRVFTAGGSGADLSIEGLTTNAAGVLKDQILARVAATGVSSAR